MLAVDAIVGAVILLVALWGFRLGLEGTPVLVGFAVGAALGTRAPLVVGIGLQSSSSLLVAVPAALLLGGVVGGLVERFGPQPGRWLGGHPRTSSIAGALLAGAAGVVMVWLLAPVATQVRSLRDPVDRSTILARLNSVATPAGPAALRRRRGPSDNFPTFSGPAPKVPPIFRRTEKDPDVLAAQRSVVKVLTSSCHGIEQGSGWVVSDSIVVTNAHVVVAGRSISVRLRGMGRPRPATAIWFDRRNDVALLRVPALSGVPALRMVRRPSIGAPGASLGFPRGKRDVRGARLGPTTLGYNSRLRGPPIGPGFRRELAGRRVTTFRGTPEPGSSGGPLVDTRGRVLTTVFGGNKKDESGLGVPNRYVRVARRKAGPRVSTGGCPNRSGRSS